MTRFRNQHAVKIGEVGGELVLNMFGVAEITFTVDSKVISNDDKIQMEYGLTQKSDDSLRLAV